MHFPRLFPYLFFKCKVHFSGGKWLPEVIWSTPLLQQSHLEPTAQDHVQVTLEYLQQSRISLGNMCQGLGALTAEVFPGVQVCATASGPVTGHHWGSVLFEPSLQVLVHISEILPEPPLLQAQQAQAYSNVTLFTQYNAQYIKPHCSVLLTGHIKVVSSHLCWRHSIRLVWVLTHITANIWSVTNQKLFVKSWLILAKFSHMHTEQNSFLGEMRVRYHSHQFFPRQ